MRDQWIITVDGWPVNGTNGYTRKDAIANFGSEGKPWKYWREAGYEVVKIKLRPLKTA